MYPLVRRAYIALFFILFLCEASILPAQSAGNSGTISGTIQDPLGSVVPGATVVIENPVSGYRRETSTDGTGSFQFTNVPLNPYHLTASAPSFAAVAED